MSGKYILKLYVIGCSPSSDAALRNLEEIISQESSTSFDLVVIDIEKHPKLAEDDRILAVPTLIKKLPLPIRKLIGDLADKEKVLLGLNIIPLKSKQSKGTKGDVHAKYHKKELR